MNQLPIHDPGDACDLDERGARQRNVEFADVVERGLLSRGRTQEGAVRLAFEKTDELEADLRELIRRESQCCAFFAFDIDSSDHQITVRVDAPDDKHTYLDELYRATEPS